MKKKFLISGMFILCIISFGFSNSLKTINFDLLQGKFTKLKIDRLEYCQNYNHLGLSLYFRITEKCMTTISIFDYNGNEVYNEVLNEYSGNYCKSIDILTKGVYFLNIEQGNKTVNKRILID